VGSRGERTGVRNSEFRGNCIFRVFCVSLSLRDLFKLQGNELCRKVPQGNGAEPEVCISLQYM